MIDDREIWACAVEAIRQHGDHVAILAAMKADELLEAGEHDGASTWLRIVRRIKALDAGTDSTRH